MPGRALAKVLLVALLGPCLSTASTLGVAAGPPAPLPPPAFDGRLSLLTYNVEGSAWPVALDRPVPLTRIARRLAALHRAGAAPQVVVLQEAFDRQARDIGHFAGYRYVVDGPAADEVDAVAMTDADRRFAAAASWWHGETQGHVVGSGLQILSDYPVLRIRRLAFPAFACAGYDCLANKGALLVTLRIPGAPAPVDVVTTHLNCRHHSGVSDARSLVAYDRQVGLLSAFVDRWHDPALPLIVAGDFNAEKAAPRWVALDAFTARPIAGAHFGNALAELAAQRLRAGRPLPADIKAILRHGADWQYYLPGRAAGLRPVAIRVPFGHEADGTMLSDHIGYVATFALTPAAGRG